ncbi:unnamed protein product [Schistosoma mattheei]|uniref:Uncharacterized protein n=1 Tax=Schistosoma mattheei TaxID=31246 RepID=A0A3P8IEG2_9TREM|nr:unnamed protein product [Schistosoma mattheei]
MHNFILRLSAICFTCEKCLMILSRQVHIIIRQGVTTCFVEKLSILRPPK